jgi:hypothetical protein
MCGGVGDALASIDPGPAIGSALASVDPGPAIGGALADVDKFVNTEIPGGWYTVGGLALGGAGIYYYPELAAALGSETGFVAMTPEYAAELGLYGGSQLGTVGASGDVLAGLAGLSETGFAGITPEFAAELGLSGGSGLSTAGASGDVLAGLPTGGGITPGQAIQGLRLGSSLLGGGQQQQQAPQLPQMGGSMNRMPQGGVDYSGLYNLLASQKPRNPNSLLG